MAGPLAGVKVLEFSEIIAAPFGGMLLSDMGAEVIKVEPPQGEPWRLSAQFIPGESRQFISLNRGKKGLAINLRTPEGRQIIHKLVPEMDVVIINYRPDTPYNLGIDYETLSAINPRLIYVENTAFGRQGPSSHRPGYDIVVQAMTGIMAADAKTNERGVPQAVNPAIADFSTGITIAWAVAAALYARERTGKGQKVEAALMATALAIQTGSFMELDVADAGLIGMMNQRVREARERGATWHELQQIRAELRPQFGAMNAYYRCYVTKDSVIAVGCLSEALRRKAAAAMGIEDPRFDDPSAGFAAGPEARAVLARVVEAAEERMLEKTTAEWLEIFDAAGVPAGPFRSVDELRDDPQVQANGFIVDLEHPIAGHLRMVGPLLKMSETPLEVRSASPTLGQHNEEVLRALGYAPEAIAALREKGVIT
jgi:crotonobetainyl-CoA:carnitine CoA-transferase CaiB-like acyl-CoA transferase